MNLPLDTQGQQHGRFRRIVAVFAPLVLLLFLVAPSVISYRPYLMAWDDLYLFHRSVCFHDAVYRLDLRGMADCYSNLSKSPVLTFTLLPWGPAASGEAAIPLGLIALAILIWILILLFYRAAIAAGANVWALAVAALAVWLNSFVASYGGSFLSDILVSWCTLLVLIFIPLELATAKPEPVADLARGASWGFVIAVGSLAKVTFLLFVAIAMPVVLWIRFRRLGAKRCLRTAIAGAVCSLPAAIVWAAFGRNFIGHAIGFSFGGGSKFYAVSGATPLGYIQGLLKNWGWGSLLLVALIPYFVWTIYRSDARWFRIVPVAVLLLYLALCAFSPNADYRFAMPIMIALPFALATGLSTNREQAHPDLASMSIALLGCVLCSIPMLSRPDMTYIRYAGSILDQVARPGRRILLATESPFLNIETFLLAREIRSPRLKSLNIDTLVYDSIRGRSVNDSLHRMNGADFLLFHKPPLSTEPSWANEHAKEFAEYASRIADETDAPTEYMRVMKVRPPDAQPVSGERPHVTRISTDPAGPPPGLFRWTLQGTGFTPASRVVVTGLGCESGCILNSESVSVKSDTELSGVADLTKGKGAYQFQVLNGKQPSNPAAIEIK